MKKFLALFLALLMCVGVFAGCSKKTDDAVTLEQAKDYLYNVMKDKNGKALPNDYDVVGKIIIEETTFDVTWTTDKEDIKVKESSKANMWTIDLPDFNEEEYEYKLTATIKAADGTTIEVTFTPKLPVIDNRGVSTDLKEGVAYKIYFEQVNLGYTLYALNTTQDGNNKFINSTIDPKEAADFYVEVVDGGYKIYTEINGVKNYVNATATPKADGGTGFTKAIGFATESDSVFFYDADKLTYMVTIGSQTFGVGTYNAFETISLSENTYFKADNINVAGGQFPIGFMEAEYAETLEPDEIPVSGDPEANKTLTVAEAIALGKTKTKDQYTTGKYYVTGVITSITSDVYGNMMINDGTGEILVYGTFDATGANRFDAMATKPAVGDTVTVYGVVGYYNDAQLKNAWIVSINGNGGNGGNNGGATSIVYTVVDTPAADTAYKFGMVQPNAGNNTYYLAGGMAQTYYLATTEDAAAGIDVYLEATTGGYYLYTMDGTTKTYLNMIVSGTHVNGAYEATASTVYTFDAENKTIIASVVVGDADAADYWFGTRNDKNYTTVGPCAVSYAGFFCQFYAATEVEGGDVGGDNGGDNGGATSAITSIPEALTAASGSEVVLTGVVISADSWSTQYNNMSVTIKDENGNEIYVFRLGTQVGLGDTITVTGVIGVYNEANQVAQGATAEIIVVHGDNHTYEDGHCTACGAIQPVAGQTTATISFGDVANRTAFDTTQQIWEQNGITVTNLKASSTSNVADYSNPARFYKSSSLTVAFTGMTKIIFECNNASYATALQNSITAASGVTVTVNGASVEVSFSAATDSFTIDSLSGGQVRVNGLTVIAA